MDYMRELLDKAMAIGIEQQARIERLTSQLADAERDVEYYRNAYHLADKARSERDGGRLWLSLTYQQMNSVIELYEDGLGGNHIPAIKRCRELTGWGLREAKLAVDYYRDVLRGTPAESYAAEAIAWTNAEEA